MPSLRELQQRFAAALLDDPVSIAGLASDDPGTAHERIAVYRRTVYANYRNALAATYPVVHRLVGEARFKSAVYAYVQAHPSTCGDLNVYGDRFGELLSTHEPVMWIDALADVARLEWALDEAHRAPDGSRAPANVLAELARVPAGRLAALRLRLDPSCRFVASSRPILAIWQAYQPQTAHAPEDAPAPDGERLLIRRDPHGVSIERVDAAELAWLGALAAGATFGESIDAAQSATAAFDLAAALRARIADGTIVGVGH